MDLLGRTLLVRAGIMMRSDVVMDDYAEEQAGDLVDRLYYAHPDTPSEDDLLYEGRLGELVQAIDDGLRLTVAPPA